MAIKLSVFVSYFYESVIYVLLESISINVTITYTSYTSMYLLKRKKKHLHYYINNWKHISLYTLYILYMYIRIYYISIVNF